MTYVRGIRSALLSGALVFAVTTAYTQVPKPEPQMVNGGGRMMRSLIGGMEGRNPGQPALILEAGAGAGLDE
jgi:hypothetical protein